MTSTLRPTSTTQAPEPSGRTPRAAVAAVGAWKMILLALRDAAPRHPYQRAMYAAGALMLASGLVHALVWMIAGGAWEGAVSWRKPIVFAMSFCVTFLGLGWVQGLLPRSRVFGWITTALVVVGGVLEVALISAQMWRGRASHFNTETAVDGLVFTLMGVTIGVLVLGMIILTAWTAWRLRGAVAPRIAALTGLGLLLVGSALGSDLIARGAAEVERTGTVPAAVVIGLAGSGKLAHAVALHGLQVFAMIALLLGRCSLAAGQRNGAMAAAVVAYVGITVVVAAQAYAGRSMLDLSWPAAATLTILLVVVLCAGAAALLAPSPQRAEQRVDQ